MKIFKLLSFNLKSIINNSSLIYSEILTYLFVGNYPHKRLNILLKTFKRAFHRLNCKFKYTNLEG